jgi:hypothetical protein
MLDEDKFLQQWQAEVPGVGSNYQIATSMLRGLAIRNESQTINSKDIPSLYYWKYLPKECVGNQKNHAVKDSDDPKDSVIGHCMEVLFAEKVIWLYEELQPYLERCIDIHDSVAVSNVLLRYTKVTTKESNGVTIKYYQKK